MITLMSHARFQVVFARPKCRHFSTVLPKLGLNPVPRGCQKDFRAKLLAYVVSCNTAANRSRVFFEWCSSMLVLHRYPIVVCHSKGERHVLLSFGATSILYIEHGFLHRCKLERTPSCQGSGCRSWTFRRLACRSATVGATLLAQESFV